jgi:hypothetical protein
MTRKFSFIQSIDGSAFAGVWNHSVRIAAIIFNFLDAWGII